MLGLLAVLILKITLAVTLAPHPLLQPEGDLDAGEYWRLSARVLDGDVLLRGTPFYVSPLYIYWLAFARAVTGGSVTGVLVFQAVLGTCGVWLAARTATRLAGGRAIAGVVAGGALALTGIVALQEALILQSALDALLATLLAYAFTRALDRSETTSAPRGPLRPVLLGVSLALLATNRPNAWLLAIPVGGALLWPIGRQQLARQLVPVVAGVGLVLAPLAVRTAVATGTWQVLPGHGGLNLYIGNHPGATGTYTVLDDVRPSMAGQREDTRLVASKALGREVTDAEASSWFARRAVDWWLTDPVAAVRLFAYKLWLSTHAWELPVNVSYAWFRSHVGLLGVLPVGAWLLLPVGIAAAIVVPRREADEAWRAARWLLPTYLVSVALFFVVDRYRAPALVFACLHVGVLATLRRADVTANAPRLATAGVVAVALAAGALVPLPFHLGVSDADTRMALDAIAHGRDEEADAWIEEAVRIDPAPGVVWLRSGLAWQARGDLARAERALRQAHRIDGDEGAVAFSLAEVLLAAGKGADAVPLLRQAANAGIRPDRVSLDLALAQWQAGDEAGARATLAGGVPDAAWPLLRARALASVDARRFDVAAWLLDVYRAHDPRDVEVTEKLGLAVARRGDLAGAARLLEEAASLDAGRASVRFNLAVVRLQQGRRTDAVALLREALRLDPGYVQAAGALRELGAEP